MIKHFLFDLDGTLLPLDEDMFLKLYLGALGKKLHELGFDSKQMIDQLWKGTEAMVKNQGHISNEEVFWGIFYPEKSNQDHLKDQLKSFYRHEFDIVKKSTKPSEFAKKIIDYLQKHKRNTYLLTNPIFPKVATKKRIEWAGLSDKDFKFISTYENSFYAKPNVAYYQEILNQFDLKAEETMMVGNDVDEDMIAQELGMDTYLVTDCLKNKQNASIKQFKHGSLEDFYHYLVSMD